MKVFGYFDTAPASCYPQKATDFASVAEAKEAFERFVEDCDRHGQFGPIAVLFAGKSDGDEETCGYPDCPDFVSEIGPKGGVKLLRA